MPAVSVILPVYGVEDYIEVCLRSLARQMFRDFELILVDDGCLDGSIGVASAFLEGADFSWRVLRQENAGQGPARDTGIRAAVGKYVVCVDPDDTVSPQFLETLYRTAEERNCDICFSGHQMGYAPKTEWPNVNPVFQDIEREELMCSFLQRTLTPILPAMLIRRRMILEKQICAYPGCRISEDVYLMWLLFSASEKTVYTKEPLYGYLCRPGSTTTASSAARILTGYPAFQTLAQDPRLGDFTGRQYLLPRWVLGVLRSSARFAAYPDFLDLAVRMSYREIARAMSDFSEAKARVLAALLRVHPRLFYQVVWLTERINRWCAR